ncbi:hypothetical protein [Blastococcus sp. SYSU DS1024]
MSGDDATAQERLSHADLVRVLEPLEPGSVTVTGPAGSGYSRIVDLLGVDAYAGSLPVDWTTPVLVVMYDELTAAGVEMLEGLGMTDPQTALRQLRIGGGFVIRRR